MSETRNLFSKRTAWDLNASSISIAVAKARAAGRMLLDLTISNPTRCEFEYDAEAALGAFSAGDKLCEALVYDPDPRGMRSAREAVVQYYADHGADVDAGSLILTTSTSEAYSYLFRLLCDGGDEVLVAQPSYPLFEFLADLDDVRLTHYPLFYDYGWWIDFVELERRIGPRTRAILVVHPNNPTGHWTHKAERERLESLCEQHGLALIVDEVFLDYPIDSSLSEPTPAESFAAGSHRVLTFVLSGISKVAALPQMKAAWIVAKGPEVAVSEAMSRLEVIADTFLSMNAPTQLALPVWLLGRRKIQLQLKARMGANLQILRASGLEVLHVEAGWSAVVDFRGLNRNSPVVETLLERANVIVHPGDFYGLTDNRVVVSLITPTEIFRTGVERICLTFGAENLSSYSLP